MISIYQKLWCKHEFFNNKPQNSLKHIRNELLLLLPQLNAWHSNLFDRFFLLFCFNVCASLEAISFAITVFSWQINKPKKRNSVVCLVAPFLMGQMQFCIAIRHFHFAYDYDILQLLYRAITLYIQFFSRCNFIWLAYSKADIIVCGILLLD